MSDAASRKREEFLGTVERGASGVRGREVAERLLTLAQGMGIYPEYKKGSVSLRYDITDANDAVTFFLLSQNGRLWMRRAENWSKHDFDVELQAGYNGELEALFGTDLYDRANNRPSTGVSLLIVGKHLTAVEALLRRTVAALGPPELMPTEGRQPFQRRVVQAAEKIGGLSYRTALVELIEWSERQSALIAMEHDGTQDVVKYVLNTSTRAGRVVWSSYAHQGKLALLIRDIAPLDMEPARTEFRRRLAAMPGMKKEWLPEETPSSLLLNALANSSTRRALEEVLEWAISLVANETPDLITTGPDDPVVDYDGGEDHAGVEGRERLVTHVRRERNRKLVAEKRQAVLTETGTLSCEVCDFDFARRYGTLGHQYCEVHHLRELASVDGARVTSLRDLAIVCSNCHRMLHREYPALDLDGLRSKLRGS